MTHSSGICKKFISASNALQCKRTNRHYFHKDCVSGLSSAVGASSSGAFHCTSCKGTVLLRRSNDLTLPSRGSVLPMDAAPPTTLETESIMGMVASLLGKMSSTEAQLGDLFTIKL